MDVPTVRPGLRVLSNDGQKLGWIARVADDGAITVAHRKDDLAFEVPGEEVAARMRDEIFLAKPWALYADRYGFRPEARRAILRILPRGHLWRRLRPVFTRGAGSP